MKKFLILTALWLLPVASFADVYPFEEDYSDQPVSSAVIADLGEPDVVEEELVVEEVLVEEEPAQTVGTSGYGIRTITYKNFGTVMINLAKGVGNLYKGLFTEAFPSYGADLISIPAVSTELTGRMIEIERQALFEADAKQKEIDAYRESVQKPLTPEEQALLEKLQAKQQ